MIAEVRMWGRMIGAVSMDGGNALIDVWLATQGRTAESFSAVERLCYTGARGMGALDMADFEACAKSASMKRGRARVIADEVREAVGHWPEFAAEAKISDEWTDKIRDSHRLNIDSFG